MKRAIHPISKMTQLALLTLGKMIKLARLELNMSQEDLARRLNVSRLTVIEIEKGGPKVSIGTVFEAAAIVNISLLADEPHELKAKSSLISNMSALLPKRGGRKKKDLNDEF